MKKHASAYARFGLSQVAATVALGLAVNSAWGLGLGKLTVQSALGETLRAEIDISSLSPEEAASLKLRVAPPESYRASGLEYNAVLAGAQVQLVRRADGRPYLRLSSDRAVQEPFVDVILELNWSSGRLVREFTLLFDPPTARSEAKAPTEASTAPLLSTPPASTTPLPAASVPAEPPRPRAEAAKPAASRPAPAPQPVAQAPKPAPAAPAPKPATAAGEYTVKPGDSLYKVAARNPAAGVSLEQMLVGLYRNNPDAFVDNNMNRLKSGAVLQVPGSDALAGLSQAEARQIIQAQSGDFGAYRQRLATAAPTLKPSEGERQAKGQVQAAVDERKPATATTPDKLTLSKAGAGSEAKASKDTEKKDAAARVAELTRNVEELKKLSAAAKPDAAAPTTQPAPAPAAPSAPTVVAAAPVVASAASAAPVIAAASKPASKPMAAPPPAAEPESPSLLDSLGDFAAPLGVALVALLGGLGYRQWRSRRAAASRGETAFSESRLQPDSFFGASGGQRVDTRDSAVTGQSSMSYSLSQLDAIGDVDPVAEADVYLAYGRDLQAEEILKEALRANPERLAIRLKLLEVYAKRRDIKGFEQLAIQLYAETQGQGEDWAKVQELGRQVDPDNPLYQPGGAPITLSGDHEDRPEPMNASTLPAAGLAVGAQLATDARAAAQDSGPASLLDLDLDLDLASPPVAAPAASAMEATQALATSVEQAPLSMDLDLDVPAPAPAAQATELEFNLDDLDLPPAPAAAPAPAALDFDLGGINLDLPGADAPAQPLPVPEASDFDRLADELAEVTQLDADLPANFDTQLDTPSAAPATLSLDDLADLGGDTLSGDEDEALQRQLELAEEFRQIGDTEGARDVLQELVAKASGGLKDKAQALLNQLR